MSFINDDSHVYCMWFAPFEHGDNFFAAMINDADGDRVIYRFEQEHKRQYYVMTRGDNSRRSFRKMFNRIVESFCHDVGAQMEYLPVDASIDRALEIIEQQPWADEILPE